MHNGDEAAGVIKMQTVWYSGGKDKDREALFNVAILK